jgi:DNA polymerase III alpha subunit
MNIDTLGIPIYNYKDIMDILYSGNIQLLSKLVVDPSDKECEKFDLYKYTPLELDCKTFDSIMQQTWFIPEEYLNINVEHELLNRCTIPNEINRIREELEVYKKLHLMNLLKWIMYFVDVCIENNIIKGPGRGSCVSSYVLFLLGLHNIDSLKYNLDYREFLRIGD